MKHNIIATALIIALSLITINCSKNNGTTVPVEPTSLDGEWKGTTSQGRAFSITVTDGSITSIYIGYNLSGNCSSNPTGHTMLFYIPREITGNSFSITGSTNISGTFNSGSRASGSFSISFTGNPPGCSSTASGTWTVTK